MLFLKNKKNGLIFLHIIGIMLFLFSTMTNKYSSIVIGYLVFNPSIFIFPLIYITLITITEIYGFKTSKFAIINIYIAFLIFSLIGNLIYVINNDFDYFRINAQMLVIITIGYIISSFCSCYFMEKIKSKTVLFIRYFRSITIAILLNTIIFYSLIFISMIPMGNLIELILTQIIMNISYVILFYPLVREIAYHIKKLK